MALMNDLNTVDPEVSKAIDQELNRQRNKLELIASENIVSKAVMAAQGSVLTNKYAEGYPGKRYYGGCEYVDVVEQQGTVWCRLCQCTASFWCSGQYGSVLCPVDSW